MLDVRHPAITVEPKGFTVLLDGDPVASFTMYFDAYLRVVAIDRTLRAQGQRDHDLSIRND